MHARGLVQLSEDLNGQESITICIQLILDIQKLIRAGMTRRYQNKQYSSERLLIVIYWDVREKY